MRGWAEFPSSTSQMERQRDAQWGKSPLFTGRKTAAASVLYLAFSAALLTQHNSLCHRRWESAVLDSQGFHESSTINTVHDTQRNKHVSKHGVYKYILVNLLFI
jgi:hypothetical protein